MRTNDTDYCIEGYERLCAAIVERAAIDYKGALLRLRRHPYDTSAQRMVSDCERFFRNEISMYVDVDGEKRLRNRWYGDKRVTW